MKGKKFLLNFAVNIKKRFFFTNHDRAQVNKCIYEYFYFEEKIFNIIDHPDIKHLLHVDYKKNTKYNTVKQDNINSSNNNVSRDSICANNINKDTEMLLKNKKDEFNFNLENEDNEIKDIICDKKFDDNLKNVINNHICNYINSSSKYFTHLCIYYIYNNEKSRFVKLLQNFNNYCFSYEDLFILFYLICRINYKDTQIIHNMLQVFEIYYYKLDNFFSYKISNIFFSPHNDLHTAINNLPLVYKVKLINMDVYSVDPKERIKRLSNNITVHSKETINTYIANNNNVVAEKSNHNSSNNNDNNNNNDNYSNNNSNNIMNNNNSNSSEGKNYEAILNHNNVTNKDVAHTEKILNDSKLTNNNIENVNNDYLEKIDENNAELELQNLEDVDMESYEKKISKDSVKYININTKKERQKIKSREGKYEGLKLRSALLTQIRNYIEEENINKDISTYNCISQNSLHNITPDQNNNNKNNNNNNNNSNFILHNNYIDKKNFEIKELLTIFIHDKELAEKNHYIKDFIHIIINYFIMNKYMIHTNFILLILFMNKINYYNNKKLNKCVQDVLTRYIKSMHLNEQDIYDFINNKKKKSNSLESKENVIQKSNEEHKTLTNNILNEEYNILELLYNQQYTYNFILYDENNYYDDNFQYIAYKLLKNYFYLVSYIMTLPFIKWNILKSYINSFNMFINIFKENKNISSSLHISDISFICASFLKTKIMEHQLIHTLFNILNDHLDHYLIIQEKKNIYNETKEKHIQYANDLPNVEPNINDILTFLHFLYFFKLSQYNDVLIKVLIISFKKFILLNDTQQLIFYNTIEGIRKNQNEQNNRKKINSILNYFNYDQNFNHFLKRNKNIQKQSLGMLFC
ncbi:conserved Plasmodium protein, unknown function [Plasmodium sp. DRC-Itaito]|nr:conserved Plasmodium protein, unknown function [Plasmodium sp. DRC-Itaito]